MSRWADPGVGLCSVCAHVRVVENQRGSRYYLCERSLTDSQFVKYPSLPVAECPGFEHESETLED
ncbi:MAG: hypothetical protein BMS9Abin29_0428 [Gemmatimonadota bacterium]|nr:MAG: hypothetical protein BMS9Abin29_0428 [Gemmatimonadota bacterium]